MADEYMGNQVKRNTIKQILYIDGWPPIGCHTFEYVCRQIREINLEEVHKTSRKITIRIAGLT